ncbi:MAG: DUF4198 domain-containing protein [Pseudomonadota bacterium]
MTIYRRLRTWAAAIGGLAASLLLHLPAQAHEFWMLPDRFAPAAGTPVSLTLAVGENFSGEQVGFSRDLVASFRAYSAAGITDLGAGLAAGSPTGTFKVPIARSGTHVIAMDSHPSRITLSADKFHAYLREEGLDFIAKAREAAGTANTPGRERYRRNVKVLVQAGAQSDATFARRTGQLLEIVPMSDPHVHVSRRPIEFQVFFDSKPLQGALLKFWNKDFGQVMIVRTITDADGKVKFTPPWPGTWMASTVHMVAARESPASREDDWDSYWGNLTFALRN